MKRSRLAIAILLLSILAALFSAMPTLAGPESQAPSAAASPPPNPSGSLALQLLKKGNAAFVGAKSLHPHQDHSRIVDTADGQHPFATIVSCSDSRVPPEEIFDQGVGDLFLVRVAGNVLGADEEASVEYGAEHLKTPLLVIMGHTKCGAVTAAATHAKVGGHLPKLLALIEPAVDAVVKGKPKSKPEDLVKDIVAENVRRQIAHLLSSNALIRELILAGKLDVVGAVYDISEGTIDWLGPHSDQAKLLAEKVVETVEAAAPSERASASASVRASSSMQVIASASASAHKAGTKDDTNCEPCQEGPMQSYVFAGLVFIATLGGALAMMFVRRG